MDLSLNSPMNLTKGKERLKGILKESFKLICFHDQIFTQGTGKIEYYCPMVSFCDIPLSRIKNQIDSFRHYGIGLTKEQGVLYCNC